jgi:hypothetical protein
MLQKHNAHSWPPQARNFPHKIPGLSRRADYRYELEFISEVMFAHTDVWANWLVYFGCCSAKPCSPKSSPQERESKSKARKTSVCWRECSARVRRLWINIFNSRSRPENKRASHLFRSSTYSANVSAVGVCVAESASCSDNGNKM